MAKHTRKHSRRHSKKTRRVRRHRGGGCPKVGQPCPKRCDKKGNCQPHIFGEDNCKGYRGAQHCDKCEKCGETCIWSP